MATTARLSLAFALFSLLYASSPAQKPTVQLRWELRIPLSVEAATDGKHVLVRTSDQRLHLLDGVSGKSVIIVEDVNQARFSNGRLLLLRGRSLEVWDPDTPRRLLVVVTDLDPQLGAISGRKLFFTDRLGVHRVSLATSLIEQTRGIPWMHQPHPLSASARRVLFNSSAHEVYSLEQRDLENGWRTFCNARPDFVHEGGFIGSGPAPGVLVSVGRDGKPDWIRGAGDKVASLSLRFAHHAPAVSRRFVAVGGVMLAEPTTMVGPSLFGLNRRDGSVAWKVPMLAESPVLVGRWVAVLAGNRPALQLRPRDRFPVFRLQLRSFTDGSLVWSGGDLETRETEDGKLAASDRLLLMLRGDRLQAYTVR